MHSATSLKVIGVVVSLALGVAEASESPSSDPVALSSTGLRQQERGDYAGSEASFRRAVGLYEQGGMTSDVRLAEALNGLGAAVYYQGRHKEAEALYRRALAIFEQRNRPALSWAATMKNLCTLDRERADLGSAEERCRKAVAMIQYVAGDSSAAAAAYAELAMISKMRGDLARALELIGRAQELQKQSPEPERLPLWTLWSIRGEILNTEGEFGEAEALYRRAYNDCSRTLGADNVRCAAPLNGLGLSMASLGASADAQRALERALHIFEANYGVNHPRVVAVLTNLGSLAVSTHDYGRAQRLLERAASICEKVMGPGHPDTAATLMNLAGVYVHRRKFDKAEALYNRAIEIDTDNHVPKHKLAVDFNNLGVFFYSTRRWDKSEAAFLRSIDLYEQSYGRDHLIVAGVLGNLGEDYRAEGRDRDAIATYHRAIAIWDKHPDIMDRQVANILDHYAQLMRKTADYAEANRAEAEAMRIRVKNTVVNDPARTSFLPKQ